MRQYPGPALAAATIAVAALSIVVGRHCHRQKLVRGELQVLKVVWTKTGNQWLYARYHAGTTGKGNLPVVLVHGWGVSGSYFLPTAERLAADFAVYVPDLPGHGRSDTPDTPLDVPGLARALLAWMDAMGLERVALVGHSMGCQTVVEAAVRYPSRVERLVLVGPTLDPAVRSVHAHLARAAQACLFERPGLIKHIVADYGRMGPRLLPEALAMLNDPIEEKLPSITQPVLLVRGQRDAIAQQRWLDEVARLVGTGRAVVIPGWGHSINYSAADQLVAALRPFLRQASSA